jgi:hypothetical protein
VLDVPDRLDVRLGLFGFGLLKAENVGLKFHENGSKKTFL